MVAGGFSGQITAWAAETKQRMKAVRDTSVERVVETAQTLAPTDTGFLRSSVVATINDVPVARERPDGEARYTYSSGPIVLVIDGAALDDTLIVSWTANYARYVEFGARGRPARRFVGMAVQQWPQIVAQAAAELQGNVQGRQAIAVYQGGAL